MQSSLKRNWLWLGTLVLFCVLLFAHLFAILRQGLVPDELNYMLMTKVLASKQKLYVSFVDHQPPGIAILGLPFYWLFSNSVMAAKSAVAFYTVVFSLSLAHISFQMSKSRVSAIFAALFGGYFAALYGRYIGVNVSSYAAICVAIGTACVIRSNTTKPMRCRSFLGGLLFGLAFMTKPSIVFELPFVLGLLYLNQRSIRDIVICMAGCILTVATIFAYFALNGTLYEMVYVSFFMNFNYLGIAFLDMKIQGVVESRNDYWDDWVSQTLLVYSPLLLVAVLAWQWGVRHQRSTQFALISLWILAAFAGSFLSISMSIRYFFHIIAPCVILISYYLVQFLKSRVTYGVILVLLPFVALSMMKMDELYPSSFYQYEEHYETSSSILEQYLDHDECVLTWGWLAGINYFSDHPACARIPIEGNMMPRGVYDIRPLRAWYFDDILTTRPKLLARQFTWSYFPELERLITNREPKQVANDRNATYFTLDWSNFYAGDGRVDDYLDLIGYDLLPSRQISPGTTIAVTLYWKVLRPPVSDYQSFVHITALDNPAIKIAALDTLPTDPYIPSSQWRQNDVVVSQRLVVDIPADTPEGNYELHTGMYIWTEIQGIIPVTHYQKSTNLEIPSISLGNITIARP